MKDGKYEKTLGSPEKMTWDQTLVLYLHDLVWLMVTVVLVFLLVFRVIVVSGDSMYDTLLDGDYLLLLSNVFYRDPEQGDIIVISKDSYDNGAPIVKRVIATEGQTVDIDPETGAVSVDGVILEEPYISTVTTTREPERFPEVVRENCIFVMGDNRGVSLDSRSSVIGQVEKEEILGRAMFLFLPGTSHGQLPRDYARIGAVE